MERGYLDTFWSFSLDALALVILAQRARDTMPDGHERPRFDGNSGAYVSGKISRMDYEPSRSRYNIKQPTSGSRR